jgi:aspartyl-tRNA(Asn)/glutamyl-tRNA(Gln) amidotransferase subunit B
VHVGGADGRIFGADYSLVDYNRSGVPLLEIVTKPISCTGAYASKVAAQYVRELRDIMRALNVSDARMERGNIRADVNLSLSQKGSGELGIRSETKNVNSFRSIEHAIEYEIRRHASILSGPNAKNGVVQETRHWHEDTLSTSAGRVKSDSDDYRYFPEPDLVPVVVSREDVDKIRKTMPELPREKRSRLQKEWGFLDKDMQDIVNADAIELIKNTISAGASPKSAKKWWLGELSKIAKENSLALVALPIKPADVAKIELLIAKGTINDKIARTIIDELLQKKGTVEEIVKTQSLEIMSDDSALIEIIKEGLEQEKEVAEKLRNQNLAPIGIIIGYVMRKTGGKADAKKVRELEIRLSSFNSGF